MLRTKIASLAQEHPISFVLSSGRTGTVFLTRLIDGAYGGVRCIHEPPPSRTLLMAGNVRNQVGLGTSVVQATFDAALYRRLRSLAPDERYIEINPLLVPTFDVIDRIPARVNILHMVRDPRTWAPSMRTFKASGFRRHLIDWVPFTKPIPAPRPRGWFAMSLLERSLWQWRYGNERIEKLFADRTAYRRVRYEDVFSSNDSVQRKAVREALEAVGLDPAPGMSQLDTQVRANPSPSRPRVSVPEQTLQRICGDLAARYGYGRASDSPA